MSRLYAIQIHNSRKGWVDFLEEDVRIFVEEHKFRARPGAAPDEWTFKKEKEALKAAKDYTEVTGRPTRVIRKPHGWEPPQNP